MGGNKKKKQQHCFISTCSNSQTMNHSLKPLTDQCISIKCPANLHALQDNSCEFTDPLTCIEMQISVCVCRVGRSPKPNFQPNAIPFNRYKTEQLLHTYCIKLHSFSTQLFRILVHYEFIHMYFNAWHIAQTLCKSYLLCDLQQCY